MELLQLRYFFESAKNENFAKTAEKYMVPASSVSASVKRLEDGGISLDESLSAFEEAVKLVKYCNEKIEAAEQKVKVLVEGANGVVSDAPFDADDAT